jgi:hypothetical protein
MFCITFATALGTFGLVAYATSGYFLIALVPLMGLYYFLQAIYRASARELKRLDAVTRVSFYFISSLFFFVPFGGERLLCLMIGWLITIEPFVRSH